jgi:succinate dehydrogenase/fumarate reductase flavoprotein subunit
MYQKNNYSDVLVVGAGMAGLSAAVSAAMRYPSLKITIITASEMGSGGCSKRTHGINAALNNGDKPDIHVRDTIVGGGHINNYDLVNVLCHDVIDRVKELESWGVRFDKTEAGEYDVGTYGGSTNSRSVHRYDITGLEIMHELEKRLILHGGHMKENRWVKQIISDGQRCTGVIAFDRTAKKIENYFAKAVILATGGGACVYPISSISLDKLGTGILMGYNAGVPLIDMEMVQFHPTGVLIPGSVYNGSLFEEEMRMQGGVLINGKGRRYMFDYDERGERATRDIVARSSYLEIMKGNGTDLGGVIFDLSKIKKDFLKRRFPKTVKRLRSCNIDLMLDDRLNCSPTAHFLMGGMMINTRCETSLSGLYACGEDAGGIHGGNRLGGNGVADALVFGYRAGRSAGDFALKTSSVPDSLPAATAVQYYNQPQETCGRIEKKIKQIMWTKVGLVRNRRELLEADQELLQISIALEDHKEVLDLSQDTFDLNILSCIELYYKLQLAQIITRSACLRKNSVGAHYVADGAENKEKYNVIIQKETSGVMCVTREQEIN